MAQDYTRQSTFADGDTITAALFNDEYNQLVNAFAYSSTSAAATGHRHDGTAAQGGNIPQIGDLDFNNKIVVDDTNNRWGFFVEVSSAAVEQIRVQDGAIVPVTTNDIDLGTNSLQFKNLYIDGTATIDDLTVDASVVIGTTLSVSGTTTLSGDVTLGNASADTLIVNALVNSNFVPETDSLWNLGSASLYWANAYVDAVTTTGNVAIGGNLTVTGDATINGNLTFGNADTDSITIGAEIDSNLIPNTDDTYDLGSATKKWQDIYIDGTAYLDAINFNGTAITATAAELNIMDGVTATATEINVLDGITSTTAELNILDGVTSTAAELNLVDGSSAGTVVNSKAVIYGAAGEVNATTLQVGGVAITSTPAELNILDGVTATTAELNILDGVTSTTAELNILDGVTATAAELNVLDGVTAFVDEDNMVSNSATSIPSQQSVKAYVDSQVTAQDLDFQGDSGGALSIDLDSETLTIAGGTGIDTSGATNTLTVAIDSTVATLTGSQTLTNKTLTTPVISSISNTGTITLPTSTDTLVGRATTDTLTNKTLTSPVLNTGVSGTAVLDDDTFATASATTLATSESIKAYVDSQGASTLSALTDTNITTPADASLLFYDTGTSKWIDNVVSGDITIADTGVAAIESGVIVNADVNASAAISVSKTALTAGTGLTLTTDTLSVDASQTQITAVGTIATGTWQGTAIADAYVDNDLTISGGTVDNTVIGGTTAAVGTFTTANATTVDTTNLEVTNLKAKDGTSAGSIADSTGVVTLASSVLTTADINGGTVDGANIGATTAGTGRFTTLNATGKTTFDAEIEEQQYSLTGTAIDPSNGTIQYKTLSANTTFTESLTDGEFVTLMIDDGSAYTITWPTTTWVGGSAPTLETTGYNVIELWHVNGVLYGAFVGAA
jgi:hypothetical protein